MPKDAKEKLIDELLRSGYLKNTALIEAFRKIDRVDFVPEARKTEAYGNYPLSIGYGQTISQPLTVAFMLELLEPKQGEKVLDIGAGSGWQTALLAHMVGDGKGSAGHVVAIERIPELKAMAEANVAKFGFLEKGTVEFHEGDGALGYAPQAPYDKIIAAASAARIPQAWKEQLKIGGRIVAPVRESIVMLEKTAPDAFIKKQYFGFSFVPLISEFE